MTLTQPGASTMLGGRVGSYEPKGLVSPSQEWPTVVRGQLTSLASTPSILSQKDGAFSPDLYATFSRFYLSGFFETLQFLLSQARDGVLSVFYPSSVYVERRPAGFAEYSMVKIAGEILCGDLNRIYPRLKIRIERLPRVLTDQTTSVTPAETADPVSIMLPLIRKVHLA
jgi:hypothetical protein